MKKGRERRTRGRNCRKQKMQWTKSWENHTCNFIICSVHPVLSRCRLQHTHTRMSSCRAASAQQQDSSLRAPRPMVQVSILGNGNRHFPSSQRPRWLSCPPSLLSNEYPNLFPNGVNLNDHSHLLQRTRMCSAIPPLPHTSSWRGVQFSTETTLPPYINMV
jgi:hypothetical protein